MTSIAVSTCPIDQLDTVRPLLERTNHKPLRFLLRELRGELDDFWLQELATIVEDGQGELLLATCENRLVGSIALTRLPWETKILGRAMGALKHLVVAPDESPKFSIADQLLKAATRRAMELGVHSLLCKTYTDDMPSIHALEANGFLLMDTLLDFIYDYRRNPLSDETPDAAREPFSGAAPADVHIRLAGKEDEKELLALAHASFTTHFGRFHADPRISAEDATNLYIEWIRACSGGYADWILVAEVDGRLAGYSAWKRPSSLEQRLPVRVGHYSIAGVHPKHSGKGLFSTLTRHGMRLLDGSADLIEGPTHINNYPVQQGYARLRWRIGDARHSFHRWLTAATP